ncbi:sulfite exporter TauE/SafE family protein [Hartmannibacter diazotrophicus]|uniref:sulfite exporter TauE/SafE family protein n=1 Tax=Hartmannibacter diazotrophicus TaxID=1482074 RepID=UPI0018D51FBB
MTDLLASIQWSYSVAGLLVGCLIGLTGVGGGSLMTPLLVLFFGVKPATAVGTDLLYASITKLVGTAVHGFKGTTDWRVVGLLALGSVPAALLTVGLIAHFDLQQSESTDDFITKLLGGILLLTSAGLVWRRHLTRQAKEWSVSQDASVRAPLTIAVGAALGVLVSLSSIGAGAIGVTALILLYPRLPIVRLVGSDIAHAVPLTMVAGLGHVMVGTVDMMMLISLLVGSVPGIIVGSWLSPVIPDKALRYLLAVTLAVVGLKLLVG